MAGGGMGGVSSTGYGQQSVQSPFANTENNPVNTFPAPEASKKPIFDAQYYLQQNPDVAANTYFNANPYQHYLQYGMSEGRSPFAPQVSAPVTAPAPVQETPYIPVTTTFSTQQQGPTFNAPIVTQANEGAAVNYQYNRGGIASLVRR